MGWAHIMLPLLLRLLPLVLPPHLEGRVALLREEREAIVDEGLVEQHAGALQEVSAVAGDVRPAGVLQQPATSSSSQQQAS